MLPFIYHINECKIFALITIKITNVFYLVFSFFLRGQFLWGLICFFVVHIYQGPIVWWEGLQGEKIPAMDLLLESVAWRKTYYFFLVIQRVLGEADPLVITYTKLEFSTTAVVLLTQLPPVFSITSISKPWQQPGSSSSLCFYALNLCCAWPVQHDQVATCPPKDSASFFCSCRPDILTHGVLLIQTYPNPLII